VIEPREEHSKKKLIQNVLPVDEIFVRVKICTISKY
jgi:hypothetical protein